MKFVAKLARKLGTLVPSSSLGLADLIIIIFGAITIFAGFK